MEQTPHYFREPRQIQSPSLSPITYGRYHLHCHHFHLLLLVLSFILNLRLGSFANPFLHKPFPFLGYTGLISRTLGAFNVFILLNGWIYLHGVLY